MKNSEKINILEVFRAATVDPVGIKSMKTRVCKKLEIPEENGLILFSDLLKVRAYYATSSSKYKHQIVEVISDLEDKKLTKKELIPSRMLESNNVILEADPFESAFVLPKLLEFLKETNNFDAISLYEREVFNIRNFIR